MAEEKQELCNGEIACVSTENTGELWYSYCEVCDATREWFVLPTPHVKDKDYDK